MSRCSSCTKMKMLSTPTASTRKGITSMMMRVAETPAYEHVPNAAATDNMGDEARVSELKELASSLGVSKSVHFVLNQPYPVLKQLFGQASVGIHTMWNEHFGIGVVEMMAAGLIT